MDDTPAGQFLLRGRRATIFRDRSEVGAPGSFDLDFSQLTPAELTEFGRLTENARRKP